MKQASESYGYRQMGQLRSTPQSEVPQRKSKIQAKYPREEPRQRQEIHAKENKKESKVLRQK